MVSRLRVSAPGKFTVDSVTPNDNNGMLGARGFTPSFILMMAGQVLETRLPLGQSAGSKPASVSVPQQSTGWRSLYSYIDNDGSLLTGV